MVPRESSAPASKPDPEPQLDARGLVVSTVLGLLAIMAIVAGLGLWFREPLLAISRAFVETFGGPGIAIGFFVPDAFTVPIPNDAFSTFGIAAGMPFWEVVAWGTFGSILGGTTGWAIGGRLRRTAWFRRIIEGRGASLAALTRRHGVLVVAVAALTPLPYSVSCWAAGAVDMPYPPFFAASLLRIVRVAGTLYLIQLGLVGTG